MATDTLQGLAKEVPAEAAESLAEVRELFTEEQDTPSSASMVLAAPEHRDAVLAWASVMWSKGLMVEIADEVGRDSQSGEVQPYVRGEAWSRK